MIEYRIVEYTGHYEKPSYLCDNPQGCDINNCKRPHIVILQGRSVNKNGEVYIPRYVVQSIVVQFINDYTDEMHYHAMLKDPNCRKIGYSYKQVKDLKEFTSLEEARKYKNELELIQGKVIE